MSKEPIYLGVMSVGGEQTSTRRAVWSGGSGIVVLDDISLTGGGYFDIKATSLRFPGGKEVNLLIEHVDTVTKGYVSFAMPPCVIEVTAFAPASSSAEADVCIFPI